MMNYSTDHLDHNDRIDHQDHIDHYDHIDKNLLEETVLGHSLALMTSEQCFSPKRVDRGTLAMLSAVTLKPGQKVLDLGCGYGVVGIACAKAIGQENVVMLDIDAASIHLAKANAEANGLPGIRVIQSDGFNALDDTGFDMILCNPPYHSDFHVAKHFIEKGFNRLNVGGKMLMVTKRREWYKKKLVGIFGGVRILQIDGYFVFEAVKLNPQYACKKQKEKNHHEHNQS